MNHITTLINTKEIEDLQFKDELKALLRKIQGVTPYRPIIIRIQIGDAGWVLNTDIFKDIPD